MMLNGKPSFLKMKKGAKGLCKCLISQAENDARSENDALMKKGLRHIREELRKTAYRENDALMKKGLRLQCHRVGRVGLCENDALMKKGLRRSRHINILLVK